MQIECASSVRVLCFAGLAAARSWGSHSIIRGTSSRQCTRRARVASISALAIADARDAGISSVLSAERYKSAFVDSEQSGTTLSDQRVVPIEFVRKKEWDDWLVKQDPATRAWLRSIRADTWPRSITPIPSFRTETLGDIDKILVPLASATPPIWAVAAVVAAVPIGRIYEVARFADLAPADVDIGWAMGTYAYSNYKTKNINGTYGSFSSTNSTNYANGSINEVGKEIRNEDGDNIARLVQCSIAAERTLAESTASAVFIARDIINTPAEHFGPADLETACRTLASKYGARCSSTVGDQLLQHGYPQVHTVGRAAAVGREPRVIELLWNENARRTVTLVGKGVCYDTGGLSIKPTASMLTMKKDLGGAAVVLGLAAMIMQNMLDVRLRMLIPAVENSVSAASYRPGDILTARNGITTLNVNSDAEGRLVLADCLAAAAEEEPALIIDCATLTGAQRVALGPEIPGMFCNDDDIGDELCRVSKQVNDLVWRMPLHAPYKKMMETNIADIKSCASGPYGGAIHAALYLEEFVAGAPWVHMDLMGYNPASSPGRPEGGEAMGMRALFHYLQGRFS